MRYVTFSTGTQGKLGALVGDRVIDLGGHGFPGTLLGFIQAGPKTWEKAAAFCQDPALSGPSLTEVRLLAPVQRPGKIMAIGLNYMDHCREQNVKPPDRPIVFAKFTTAVIGPGDEITWDPAVTDQVDYEVELCVVIGRTARNVSEAEALDYVFGYTVANDVSARDLQFSDKQWVRAKSLDTFCPLGPIVVTTDEIPDPQALKLFATVNGQVLQDSTTAEMIFGVRTLIATLSRAFTLEPGDILLTGTPDGVGVFRKPQVFLKHGDVVVVEVERIGQLENRCRETRGG
jgi:2-keto-4-pentenoate hydratase/2-oxohepta-3-ene-1,7-dioic acid hydratase in catechol pathway